MSTTLPAPLNLEHVIHYPPEVAEEYRRQGYWTDQTHADLLFDTVERVPGRIALIDGDRHYTYAEIGGRVLRLAAGLRQRGIDRGDRVVVHLENSLSYLCFLFALFELGAVPILATSGLRRHEIEFFTDFTGAKGLVTQHRRGGDDFVELAEDLKAAEGSLEHTVVLSLTGEGPELEELLSQGSLSHEQRSSPADVAFFQLSGGTTGQPKVIPHTHQAYLASLRAAVTVSGVTEDSVQLVVLPMPHSFAMRSPGFLGAIQEGATLVLTPNGSPDCAFPLIQRHGVTETAIVPPLAMAWLNSSLRKKYDLSSLRILRVGGAKFSEEAARRIRPELGATLQQSFGMAEGLHTFTGLEDDEDVITTRQGAPANGNDEILVLDDEGRDVPPGSPGNLLVRGPSIIRGYYRAEEYNATVFTSDGYYRTGDIVRRDERGYFTVVGRTKDQINRGGEKISPEEVENHLLAHGAVHDASVVGVPDEILGERIKVYVQPLDVADPGELTVQGLRGFLRERGLATHKLPDQVEVVAEFARTAVGKVSKKDQRATR